MTTSLEKAEQLRKQQSMTLAEIDAMKSAVSLSESKPDHAVNMEEKFKRMLVDRRATAIEAFGGDPQCGY